MGTVLFSAAIIISLLAMQARAPQWLLMFCGGWTLFTLVNVTWQPLMAFQLALIWAGYAFLAPRGLPQRKLWETKLWASTINRTIRPASSNFPEPQYPPLRTATDAQPKAVMAEPIAPAAAEVRKPRLNKTLIAQIFLWIFAANVLIHLIPFNYSFDISVDQIARSFGSTLAIFVLSLIGLFFRPNQTLGVALVAILIAPVCILIDRAHDPVAPRYFRELLYRHEEEAGSSIGVKAEQSSAAPASNLPVVAEGAERVPSMAESINTSAIRHLESGNKPIISSQDEIPTLGSFHENMQSAVDKFFDVYTTAGMWGAIKYSKNCHSSAKRDMNISKTDFCIAFDMAAIATDHAASKFSEMPTVEYFALRARNIDGDYSRFSQATQGRSEIIWNEVNSALPGAIQPPD